MDYYMKILPGSWSQPRGFTLIEMSVMLVIISFIVVTLFTTSKPTVNQRTNTQVTLEKVQLAMTQYATANNYYPCPADGSLSIDDAGFGKGTRTISPSLDCNDANFTVGSTPNRVFIGVIPVKDLGLGTEDMMDEWGHRLLYAISESMVENSSYGTNCGNITILSDYDDANPVDAQDAANITTAKASYILMSYGQDGIGAYPYEGGSRIAPVNLGGSSSGNYVDSIYQQINHHMYGDSEDGIFLKLYAPIQ